MLAEWISLLGLNEDQPPWDGEPREIRGKIQLREEMIPVRLVDIEGKGEHLKACVENMDNADGESCTNKIWVDIQDIFHPTLVY